MLRLWGTPPGFSYQGETKGLRGKVSGNKGLNKFGRKWIIVWALREIVGVILGAAEGFIFVFVSVPADSDVAFGRKWKNHRCGQLANSNLKWLRRTVGLALHMRGVSREINYSVKLL